MRLDHLLSKEHAPLGVTVRVASFVVVFTSGIIDIPPSVCSDLSGTWPVGVCRPVVVPVVSGWVGAHCWGSEESGGDELSGASVPGPLGSGESWPVRVRVSWASGWCGVVV